MAKLSAEKPTESPFVEALKSMAKGVLSLTHFLSSLTLLYKQIVKDRVSTLTSKARLAKSEHCVRLDRMVNDLRKQRQGMLNIQIDYFTCCEGYETAKKGSRRDTDLSKAKAMIKAEKLKKRSLEYAYQSEYVG